MVNLHMGFIIPVVFFMFFFTSVVYMYSTRQIKVYVAFYETIMKTMRIVYKNANETVNQFQINAVTKRSINVLRYNHVL